MENNRILIQNILNDYEQGMPINEIKSRNRIERAQIYKIVQQYGTHETIKKHKSAKRNKLKEKKNAIDMEIIIKDLKNGVEMSQIIKTCGIHCNALKSQIEQYAQENDIDLQEIITPNNARYFRTQRVQVPIEEIIKAVEERRQLKPIAEKYEVCATTIYEQKKKYEQKHGKIECKVPAVVKVNGVVIDPETYGKRKRKETTKGEHLMNTNKKKSKVIDAQKKISMATLWKEYSNNIPVSELELRYGISENIIRKQLNEYRNYLLTKAFFENNKTIRAIALESGLPILEVKERVRKVLRSRAKDIPKGWLIVQKSRGYTEEQILKMYILEQREENKYKQIKKMDFDDEKEL